MLKLTFIKVFLFLEVGESFECLKKFDKAIEMYDYAIKLEPRHASAYNNKGIF